MRIQVAVLAALAAGLVVVLVITATPEVPQLQSAESPQEKGTDLPVGETVQTELPRREVLPVTRSSTVDRLSDVERQEVRRSIEEHILTEKQRLWDHQESADVMDMAALHEEADILHRLAYKEAALLALEQDDFFVLPEGEGLANAENVTVVDVTSVSVEGERMSLWVALSHQRYPHIASTESYLQEMAQLRLTDDVSQFNAKSLEERKKLFEEHRAWESRHREYRDALRASGGGVKGLLTDPALYALFMNVGASPLPSHRRADKVSYLLYQE